MQRDARAFLWDAREAAGQIQGFVSGMDAAAYEGNPMAQAAVERKFEIIGEALNQLAKLDAVLATRITDLGQIVAFRNLLIHGYASVNISTVWNVVQTSLPTLLLQVTALLDELGEA
ncbi:MAG: DUF86 domain-containing protein [Variovorax sp.]|nr:MAG: DUF86 domain-containing protein [Variovorax sp.]